MEFILFLFLKMCIGGQFEPHMSLKEIFHTSKLDGNYRDPTGDEGDAWQIQ